MSTELDELARLRSVRRDLDERELDLIDRARHAGATWAQLARTLGLSSRQAAEQRRQRLAAARRNRRDQADVDLPPQVAAIRAAVAELGRWLDTDRRWDGRFRRAALVRETVEAAVDAEPGALHALATHLLADLDGVGSERLPPPVRAARTSLRAGLSTAH
ncbi:hypothetical protein ACFY3U_02995 [Micromonospora sp. NPDC000089]|uniref:hypothetical protein n=1 Tax=unclassified Micromonospora TaxID=2617518 RepID=UPI0036BC8639